MKYKIERSHERGFFDHGWLKTYHSFSFADYYNPEKVNFGTLRVLNDDLIQPHNGFGMHPHQNMEIITLPVSGSLEHEDSTGSKGTIQAGEVQVMSAGTGIMHAERNSADIPAALFQLWIFAKRNNVAPRYEQKKFDDSGCDDAFQLLVSPDGREDSLWIYQDAFISRLKTTKDLQVDYQRYNQTNGVFILVIEGITSINDRLVSKRDSISIEGQGQILINTKSESYLLVIEVPLS